MLILYSPSTNGFYLQDENAPEIVRPDDVCEISAARHAELLRGQSEGKLILPNLSTGRPSLVDPIRQLNYAQLKARAVAAVKYQAGRRIEAIAPAWRQSNDCADLARFAIQLQAEGDTPIDVTAALERRRQIDAVRVASDGIEALIEQMTVAELEAFDASADAHWS